MGKPDEPPVKITRVAPVADGPPAPAPAEPRRIAPKPQIDTMLGLFRAQRFAEALDAARAMTRDFPETMAGWNISGAAARALGQGEEAEASFQRLEALQPGFAGAPYNLALVHEDQGRVEEAIAAYARALRVDPALAQAHNNIGILYNRIGERAKALEHLHRARALRPEMPEVHNSLGNALMNARRLDEARAAFEEALRLRPDFASALYNIGALEESRHQPDAAVAAYERALAIDPDYAIARTALLYQLAQLCDWKGIARHQGHLPDLGITTEPVQPFPLLGLEDNLARQSERARRWTERRYGAVKPLPPPPRPATRPQRLKIAFYSGNFRDHPMVQLHAGLYRELDRERFEVHAVSVTPDREDYRTSEGRRRSEALVDHFHDVAAMSDTAIAHRIRELGIDILIDHDGYTNDNRPVPVAMRPAPLQLNMVGYPGSLGAAHHDYIVCDHVVVPPTARPYYSEKLLQLPYGYLPTDNAMEIAADPGTRAQHGLPEDGVVFSGFNALWKLTAREFAIWMRVLRRVPGSVLWLRLPNASGAANFHRAAAAHGIDPSRLVFAPKIPHPDHLARHAHGDILLDTFAYGSHTTGVDALWAGQLMVTKAGEQMSALTATSLLRAVGLDELVTRSDEDYEELIVALATDPARLAELKARLARNRLTMPLFDSALYARHFEAGLDAAYARHLEGRPPADIAVPP